MTNDAGGMNGAGNDSAKKGVPEDAFISPDEPLVKDTFQEAIISPDDPLIEREDEGGVVVGMDGSTQHEVAVGSILLDAEQVASALDAVSADIREHGIAELRVEHGMSEFEVALRAQLTEYFSNHS